MYHIALDWRWCPFCCNRKTTESNSLFVTNPELEKYRDYEKNITITPDSINKWSPKRVRRKCLNNENHEWQRKVKYMVKNSECPLCNNRWKSRPEIAILYELKSIFNEIKPNWEKLNINWKNYNLDIYIESLNLIIEFDGYYYHKNKLNNDILKNKIFREHWLDIIRLREDSLDLLLDCDIKVRKRLYDVKSVVHEILLKIKEIREIKSTINDKINRYFLEKEVVTKEALEFQLDFVYSYIRTMEYCQFKEIYETHRYSKNDLEKMVEKLKNRLKSEFNIKFYD